jgi:hypothetical protein
LLIALLEDSRARIVALGDYRAQPAQVSRIHDEYARRRDSMLRWAAERREGGHYMVNGSWMMRPNLRFTRHEREAMRELIGVEE